MAHWTTIAQLSTAAGTMVLALATFASVRSANRTARAAEGSLLAGLRPLLVPSRLEDPPEKVGFQDDHWVRVPGGGAVAEVVDGSSYLAVSLRNVGSGIAVLDRWSLIPERAMSDRAHDDIAQYRRLTRDLYVPPQDRGFWQGAIRDASDPLYEPIRARIEARQPITVDLLYGDFDGGQRSISRFAIMPGSQENWLAVGSLHWNLDRPEPR